MPATRNGRNEPESKADAPALRGRARCSLCGRRMQPATIRNRVHYRCEFQDREQALYPDLTHPRTVTLREEIACRTLDQWIARAFAPRRLTATIDAIAPCKRRGKHRRDSRTRAGPGTPSDQGLRATTRPLPGSPRSRSRPHP
ncbi:zinc ribbon domain-containing protein, partial [Streptomyces sp. NPDC058964]|uniref:zinc ribbon domain-containing protein n=1 Tax=Streptomyces sp. NPDC058964 TaxID=3346681 RepID=UPI0036AD1AE0